MKYAAKLEAAAMLGLMTKGREYNDVVVQHDEDCPGGDNDDEALCACEPWLVLTNAMGTTYIEHGHGWQRVWEKN